MQQGRNTDSPYAQDYSRGRHMERTEQRAWSAHEVAEEHSIGSQKHVGERNVEDERRDTRRDCGPKEKWRAEC